MHHESAANTPDGLQKPLEGSLSRIYLRATCHFSQQPICVPYTHGGRKHDLSMLYTEQLTHTQLSLAWHVLKNVHSG